MEVKKLKIKFLIVLFFLCQFSCNKDSKFFYLKELSEELETNVDSNEPSSLEFNSKIFYILCKGDTTFSTLSYLDVLNGYLNNKKSISTFEYVNKLFSSQLNIKEQKCLKFNYILFNKYIDNFDLLVKETSSSNGRFLKNNLKLNDRDIDTILLLYSLNGYLIGFDDYLGVFSLTKN
jgi:hypothetical protein